MIPQYIENIIKKHATQAYKKANKQLLQYEDLIQQGRMAYLQKIKTFKPQLNIKQSTFVYQRIHGAIYDKVKDSTPQTQDRKKTQDKLQQIKKDNNYNITHDQAIEIFQLKNKPKKTYNNISISSLDNCKISQQFIKTDQGYAKKYYTPNISQNIQRQQFWNKIKNILNKQEYIFIYDIMNNKKQCKNKQKYKKIILKLKEKLNADTL